MAVYEYTAWTGVGATCITEAELKALLKERAEREQGSAPAAPHYPPKL